MIAPISHRKSKTALLRYCNKVLLQEIMKCSDIQC